MWRFIIITLCAICFFPVDAAVFAEESIHVERGASIQEAIKSASDGAVIIVKEGQYRENLQITKAISLIGENGAEIIGNGEGNVIEVKAPGVVLKNLVIKESGKKGNEAGIYIESSNNLIENNIVTNVHFGIYVHKGEGNRLNNNRITGYPGHFSTQGNGIHLFYTVNTELKGNYIVDVQDGVYFDFAEETVLNDNYVEQARYGYHVMYAKHGTITSNISTKNVTGLMIMDTEDFIVADNEISQNMDYRGHGILIFDSDKITIHNNQVIYNNTGLSLQDARDCIITDNTFAGNYIGLDLKSDNERNQMINNNFISNIVQTKIFTKTEPMNVNEYGNYWDDYKGLDLNGDGIGEIPYKSGKWYDRLIEENPTFQLFFESPSIKMWTAIENIFPTFSHNSEIDLYPLTASVAGEESIKDDDHQLNWSAGLLGILLISISGLILYRGRL